MCNRYRLTTKKKNPTHIAYNLLPLGFGWTKRLRVGAVWMHKDGDGYDLELERIPISRKFLIRVASEGIE